MQPGQYLGEWWNPMTGEKTALPIVNVTTTSWSSSQPTGINDWALLLQKKAYDWGR
jgi:hypothetical protein